MYNFFVTSQKGAWKGAGYEYERGRFLEYTSEEIAGRFRELGELQIKSLLELPCLFAYEGKAGTMRVGRLVKLRPRPRVLYIEFKLDKNVPPIPFEKMAPLQMALDIRDWELNRTHWAIKDEDLIGILKSHGAIPARVAARKRISKADLPPVASPELRIESVGNFVKTVIGLNDGSKEVFYRGHSNRAKYRLEPSLFRKDDRGNLKHLHAEDTMCRELLVSNANDFKEDVYTLDKLVRMQHYSLPTRLMDITSNPLIALFFASVSNPTELGEVIVFEMDASQVRYFDSDTASCIANLSRLPALSKAKIDYSIANVREFNKQSAVKRLLHFIKEEKPFFEPRIRPGDLRSVLCVKGRHTNNRISFQSGAFLLFGQDATLDERGSDEIAVRRIAVSNKKRVLEELDRLNINESTVFPYIENSAKYVARKYSLTK